MSHTVLVVEDTEMLRRMYSDRLDADGFRVLTAADGACALAVLRSDVPDLILLDLIMPRMSGLEVLDLVKRDPRLKDIPVLILSNLGQEDDISRCLEMGAADYLVKNDARPADISARVGQLLAAKEAVSGEDGAAQTCNGGPAYRLLIRDHEADADCFVSDAQLPRRLWCPACEVELVLELVAKPGERGWYDAHLSCPSCLREF